MTHSIPYQPDDPNYPAETSHFEGDFRNNAALTGQTLGNIPAPGPEALRF